ncbi:MAG: hypothetical protein QF569_29520, partial [Candidatus Poribacteria bacterium]|nr:hypothetical protein [Candidatus Poribacteria bacterium]
MKTTTQFSISLAIFCFLTMIGFSAIADEFTGILTATSSNTAVAPSILTFKVMDGSSNDYDANDTA